MSNGDDFIMGGSGDDTIIAVGRESVIRGGSGDDAIKGTLGNDWLTGDTGNDTINTSGGDDFIAGGDGNDLLYGRGGDDWIIGGPGDDRMSGGDGDDVFHMHPGDDNDTIFDFRGHEDILDLRALGTQFTWAELSAQFTLADNGRDTVIDLSPWGGGTITLNNVKAAYLSQDMFWLPYPGFPAGELFGRSGLLRSRHRRLCRPPRRRSPGRGRTRRLHLRRRGRRHDQRRRWRGLDFRWRRQRQARRWRRR